MATSKPISTISYNSLPFLKERLSDLIFSHKIQAYQYICHKGEDGDKDHIHLRLEPNCRLDPMELAEYFREFVADNDKPLGVRPFRPSKEEDWILYAVHDKEYLDQKYGFAQKGEKLPYQWQDIHVSEYYDMEIAFIRAKAALAHSSVNLIGRLKSGARPVDLLLEGESPFMVNTLVSALAKTDYQNAIAENLRLAQERNALLRAIDLAGFVVVNASGDGFDFMLEKK